MNTINTENMMNTTIHFTNSQKEFFKDLLKSVNEEKKKNIITKILLESTKEYRITVLTESQLLEEFFQKNITPINKIDQVILWTNWLFGIKKDHVKNFLESNNLNIKNAFYPSVDYTDFELIQCNSHNPIIILRNIDKYINHDTHFNTVDPMLTSENIIDPNIYYAIVNIINAIQKEKVDRLIIITKSKNISPFFTDIKGWDQMTHHTSVLKWLNELQ